MPNVIKVALPGYNALTDTNPDHFALDSSSDNILIKEFARGSFTLAGNTTVKTIAHNLGYIPFFMAFALDPANSKWELIQFGVISASLPNFNAEIDTTNLYITNNQPTTTNFVYYIFYDNIDSGSPTFTPSKNPKLAVGKQGINVLTETNPNNFIFHSDLNTFKILKEANTTISYTTDGQYSFNHNAPNANAASHLVFIKWPDGYVMLIPGIAQMFSKDSLWNVHNLYMDSTKIYMTISGTNSATSLPIKYYIFETPLV